jgi:hypothetical protein
MTGEASESDEAPERAEAARISELTLASKIRAPLRRYPKQRVDDFVTRACRRVERYQLLGTAFPTEKSRLQSLKRLQAAVRRFEAALRVQQIVVPIPEDRMQLPEPAPGPISDDGVWPGPEQEANEIQVAYFKAKQDLEQKLGAFKHEIELALARSVHKSEPGRKKADAGGLAASIARLWRKCFDEIPSMTPGGPFSNVVAAIHRHLGGKAIDVGRHVRAATGKFVRNRKPRPSIS